MEVQKAVEVQIYPSADDIVLMSKHFGSSRKIFNHFLDIQQKTYLAGEKHLSFYTMCSRLTLLKKQPEWEWLKEINSQSLQCALQNLDTAYDHFFRKISKFPKFKCKHDSKQSFKVPQHFVVDWDASTLKIPKFKKPIKFRGSYQGKLLKINSITIKKTSSGKYFASIQGLFDIDVKESTGEIVGVDLGIKSLLITSNGDEIHNARFFERHLKHIKHLQRQLSKKKKGSKSRERARKRLAIEHGHVANQRKNYLHQVSSALINDNQVIVIEDLAVKNMIKNHCLAKSIQDVSWGMLVNFIQYKAAWHQRQVIKIDRWYPSSKTCSTCSHLMPAMPLDVREWTCPVCGDHHDRDINAAKNILRQGLNELKTSGCGTQSDVKQKQVEALRCNAGLKPETELSLAAR